MILGISRAARRDDDRRDRRRGKGSSTFTLNPLHSGQTMTGAMAALATGTDQVAGAGAAFPSLFFVGLLLFILTFTLNLISERFVRRVSEGVLMASGHRHHALRGRRLAPVGRSAICRRAFAGLCCGADRCRSSCLIPMFLDVLVYGIPGAGRRGFGFITSGTLRFGPTGPGWGRARRVGLLMLIVALVAFPLGVGAAVYLEEYARDTRLTRFIPTNIRNLAGVPSIVYGISGLFVFVEALNRAINISPGCAHRGRPDARHPGAADRDHHDVRGAAGGPTASARPHTASGRRSGRSSEATSCRTRRPAS